MTNEEMSAELLEFVKRRPGTSFVEVERLFPDESGTYVLASPEYPTILLWVNLSGQLCHVIVELLKSGKLETRSTSVLVYLADGGTLQMPLAKSARHYKKPRWLPVVLYVAGTKH